MKTEQIAGTKAIAIRAENARRAFVETLSELGGITKTEAERVADLYIRKKLAKTDFVLGRVHVKHGALLDRATIQEASRLSLP